MIFRIDAGDTTGLESLRLSLCGTIASSVNLYR